MKKLVAKQSLIIGAIVLVVLAIGAVCFDRFVLKLSLVKSLRHYYRLLCHISLLMRNASSTHAITQLSQRCHIVTSSRMLVVQS